MTDAKDFQPPRRRLLVPVLLTLLLTLLLHLLVIDWGKTYFDHGPAQADQAASISVKLLPLPLPQQPVSLPSAAKPRPLKRPHPKPVAAPAKPPPPAVAPSEPATAVTTTAEPDSPPAATTSAADTAGTGPEPAAAPPAPAAADTSDTHSAGTHYQLDPPPSASLDFSVHAFSDKLDWYGTSILSWKTDGTHYSVDGEVYARFFAKITFLTFTSSGDIDEFGIAPELYTEKRRNRAATNTHFNRERNLISFSASGTTYPRAGGEQDRASLIWQLSAIGRGDSSKFVAGNVIDMFVAGVRDGEVWRMQIAGQEDIRLPTGLISAWHVVRQPRPGSYEQRLDIWLAPDKQWYPVRLRFTETNGDYLELTLSDLKTL